MTNTVMLSDIFLFLSSSLLEIVLIQYFVSLNGDATILQAYLIKDSDKFFMDLNRSLDLNKLEEL
jgi:hypothetical protein